MKLLLDQNLSPRLIQRLADLYPGSIHVEAVGLDRALDNEVWLYAKLFIESGKEGTLVLF